MAQILEIRNVCDVCADIHDKETPAETYTVNVAIVGDSDSPKPFQVELCGEHGAELANAVLALVKYGRAAKAPRQTARHAGNTSPAAGKDFTCPECQHPSPTVAALRTHARREHGKSLAGIGFYPANFTCETCREPFTNRQGLAAHTRAAHPAKQSA